MELQATQAPVQVTQKHPTAPPPPVRRKLHVPAEPLVFAAVLMALVMFMAKTLPGYAVAEGSNEAPATVAQHSGR